MKIVHVCLSGIYNDTWGYQENILSYYNLKSGHDVTVIASNYIDEINIGKLKVDTGAYIGQNGVKVCRIRHTNKVPFLIANKLKLYEKLYSVLIKEKPDIILHHGAIGFTLGVVTRYVKNHKNCTFLIDNHSDQFNCTQTIESKLLHYGLWRILMRKTIPYVDKYFGVLPLRCDFLTKVYGIPKGKIELMIMGTDDEKIVGIDRELVRKTIRDKFGISMDDFLIITGGKIDLRKNIHLLMKAVNNSESKRIKLLLFGKVNSDISQIIQENMSEKIVYIGWVHSEKIYELFFASDLAVFPGTHSVLWEQACASGLPGIYNKMEGIQHVDINGNVIFVDDPTVEKLERVIKELNFDKDGSYTRMRVNAREAYKAFLYSNIENQMYRKW